MSLACVCDNAWSHLALHSIIARPPGHVYSTSGHLSPNSLSTPPLSTTLSTPSLSTPPPPLLASNVTTFALTPSSATSASPLSNYANTPLGGGHALGVQYDHQDLHHHTGGVEDANGLPASLCSCVAPLDSPSVTLAPCSSPLKADTPCSTTTLTVLQPPSHGTTAITPSDTTYSALTPITQFSGRCRIRATNLESLPCLSSCSSFLKIYFRVDISEVSYLWNFYISIFFSA